MKVVWLADLHLVSLRDPDTGVFDDEYFEFVDSVSDLAPDCVFITGDIGEAPNAIELLEDLARRWKCEIRFVLGNHDLYRSSITEVKDVVDRKLGLHPQLNYLTTSAPVELTAKVGLVGHDGWPDGRDGGYGCDGKQNAFNDFKYIEELKITGSDPDYDRWPTLKRLADEAALYLERNLDIAVERYQQVIVLTHFPPFREVAFLKGRMVDPQQASRSVSKAVANVLMRFAENHPAIQFTVLCGHMHSKACYNPQEKLVVHAGAAKYGEPQVADVFVL